MRPCPTITTTTIQRVMDLTPAPRSRLGSVNEPSRRAPQLAIRANRDSRSQSPWSHTRSTAGEWTGARRIRVQWAPFHRRRRSSSQASEIEHPSPVQHPDRDEDAQRGEHQDRRGRDRAVEIAALELSVHDQRKRLGLSPEIAREHDRGPELAQRAGPAHDEAGRQRSARQRDGDVAEELELRGAVDARGILEVAVDASDPGPGRPDEVGRRDERLGEEAATAQEEQEGQAGDGGRKNDGQVDDRLDPSRAPEPAPGQDKSQGQAERDREDQADGRRGEAQNESREHDLRAKSAGKGPIEGRPHDESDDRQAEEEPEQPGDADEGAGPPAPAHWRDLDRRGHPDGPGRRLAGHSSRAQAGGRKPNEARIAWPSGPAIQARNACAAATFGEAFTTMPP